MLGDFLRTRSSSSSKNAVAYYPSFFKAAEAAVTKAQQHNGWFTREQVEYALAQWARLLTHESLRAWLSRYSLPAQSPRRVAIVMAGNIPLVGFHDFLCVLLSGHSVIVKCASNDTHLLPFLATFLEYAEPSLKEKIVFTQEKLPPFDAVIATGSDNTARYFEYYFRGKPHIIRKNRNAVAVLTGKETSAQLQALGEDIFRYFGLGCRSVSKVFVPAGYDFSDLLNALQPYQTLLTHTKYAHNYDYNKAVYLMSAFPFLDTGFLLLKEDEGYASPIATLFYEYYPSLEGLREKITANVHRLQCLVAQGFWEDEVAFGQTQQPQLWDYADGVDTVDFLLKI